MASKLDQFLASFSRATLATVAIGGGILFIIFSDPPRTICDAQVEFLKQQQRGFLFADPAKKLRGANFSQMGEYCDRGNGPGACYELFSKMRILMRDLQTVPPECAAKISQVSEVQKALWSTTKFMVKAAWGKVPPPNYQEKFGWLDVADLALFCSMKTQITKLFGESAWNSYRETLFTELPGAKEIQRKDAWEKMILSEDCRRY